MKVHQINEKASVFCQSMPIQNRFGPFFPSVFFKISYTNAVTWDKIYSLFQLIDYTFENVFLCSLMGQLELEMKKVCKKLI